VAGRDRRARGVQGDARPASGPLGVAEHRVR
jgi:hypothetical protein